MSVFATDPPGVKITVSTLPAILLLQALLNSAGPFRVIDKTGWTFHFHFGTLPELPDVSPFTWSACDEIANKTGEITCKSQELRGMCCVSCGRTQAECNWKKSYYAARRAQTNDNWAQTIGNTLQAYSVIQ